MFGTPAPCPYCHVPPLTQAIVAHALPPAAGGTRGLRLLHAVTQGAGVDAGLPNNHWVYVANIEEGMPIFLFNYSDRSLRGLWRAAGDGCKDINPQGWLRPDELRRNPSARTKYNAQVSDRGSTVFFQLSPAS